ncbi:MAG TPA: YoaK family protein [Chloroflexia bacterium]|nr:YoaK family protein [Chloroflexia bacterium]
MEIKGNKAGITGQKEEYAFPFLNRNLLILLLGWTSGGVDVISYLGLGHVFTANMTGNTVLLGIALGRGDWAQVLRAVVALMGFLVGVALGAFIVEAHDPHLEWSGKITRAIGIEVIALGFLSLGWELASTSLTELERNGLIVLAAIVMGLQSATVVRLGVVGISTTYITGMLTTFTTGIVALIRPTRKSPDKSDLTLQGTVWIVYILSAVVTALLEQNYYNLASLLPLIAVTVVWIVALVCYRSNAARN